jgi:uncharacterized protein (TIGR02145 family)
MEMCVAGLTGKQCKDDGYKGHDGYFDAECPPGYGTVTVTGSSSSGGSSSSIASSSSSVNYTDKGNSISSYKTKTIGDQVWMAENLNYKVAGSKCYGEGNSSYSVPEVQSNCDKYGRLYDWPTAMGLDASCNSISCSGQVSTKHRGICPSGWHIPSNEEWNELYHYADGTLNGSTNLSSNYDSPTAGRYLKATSGWNDYNGNSGNGTDAHGFSALPGGDGNSGGYFSYVGNHGYWWSSSERSSTAAYLRYMDYDFELANYDYYVKSSLYSVRCLKD